MHTNKLHALKKMRILLGNAWRLQPLAATEQTAGEAEAPLTSEECDV